jgi:hypothetical protein
MTKYQHRNGFTYTQEEIELAAKAKGDTVENVLAANFIGEAQDDEMLIDPYENDTQDFFNLKQELPFASDENIRNMVYGTGPQQSGPEDVGDIVKDKLARFGLGVVDWADDLYKSYESGEGFFGLGNLTEFITEGPFEAAYGYAAAELRKRGFDVPEQALWIDLTTPAERRSVYEEHMLKMAKNPSMSLEMAQSMDPTNKVKFESAINFLNKHVYSYYDGEGVQEDYLTLLAKAKKTKDPKDLAKATDSFLSDVFQAIPSLIISRAYAYGVPVGAMTLGASAYMENFERELFNRGNQPGISRDDIVLNSLITGGSDMVYEMLGGAALNRILGPGGKELGKELLTQLPKLMRKRLGLAMLSEGVTEGLTGVTQTAADDFIFDKDKNTLKDLTQKDLSNYFRAFMKDGILGAFLGGGAARLSKPTKKNIYSYVSSNNYKQDQLKTEAEILQLERAVRKADPVTKVELESKLADAKAKKQRNEDNMIQFFDNMTDKQRAAWGENFDLQNKQLDIIGNDNFSKEVQEDARKKLKQLTQANTKLFKGTDLNYNAALESLIARTLKTTERINKQKGFFGFNQKNLDIEYIATDERVQEVAAQNKDFDLSDGIFVENKDGKSKIYINTKVAGLTGQSNVLGHEYLHAIVSRSFKSGIGRANLKNSISAFVKYLNDIGEADLVADIEAKLAVQYDALDQNGDIIRDANGLVKTARDQDQEEYFNLFSDLIKDERIENVVSKSAGLTNSYRSLLRGFGFGEVDFQDGAQVFEFLVDYKTNINRSSILGYITSKGIGRVKLKGLEPKQDKRFKSGTDALAQEGDKKSITQEEANRITRLVNDLGDMGWTNETWKEGGAAFAIKTMQEEKLLDNLIAAKYKGDKVPDNFVKKVYTELTSHITNYKPDRNNESGLFGWINPQIGNKATLVYNRDYKVRPDQKGPALDAKTKEGAPVVQPVAEETPSDFETENVLAAQVRERRGEKKQPTTAKKDRTREIQSLSNVKIDNTEIVSTNIQTKIDDLVAQNPKNLEKQITSLIEGDFRKYIQKQMGGVSFTDGKVKVSEQYKAFIALNYQNIIDGLDVATIKNNYKNLFELELIGKEDRKTKKSDKPTLKKDSNYRKGIYKITTNKAKFTKYFIDETSDVKPQSHYNKLRDRQKKLAILISQSFVEDAVNNKIASNSTDLTAVMVAELKNYLNTINRQKKEVRGNYNDQIKYSSGIKSEFGQELMGQLNKLVNEIDNASSITDVINLETQQPLKGSYDPWVVQTVFNQFLKGNVYADRKMAIVNAFKGIPVKIIKEGRGNVLELFKIRNGVKAAKKYDGFEMLGETIQEGGIPDFFAAVHDVALFAETKFGESRMGKTTTNEVNYLTKKFNIEKRLDGNIQLVEKSVKKALQGADQLVKDLKEAGFDLSNGFDQTTIIDLATHEKIGSKKAVVSDVSVLVDADFVGRLYASKEFPVYLIDIEGAGLYYMPGDPFIEALAKELGIPKLEFKKGAPLKTRILAASAYENKVKVGYRYRMTSEALLEPSNMKVKSPWSFSDMKTFDAIMNSKTVENIKLQKEAKNKVKYGKAVKNSRSGFNPSKGITVLDFDDTLATTNSLVRYTAPDGTTGTLNAEQYALRYQGLQELGYKFDFSEFNKVVDGKIAPLFQKALKLQSKFGPKNMFVLTARPPQSAKAIFDFLKANGLNIPLKNITGLANSTSEAKALWVAGKVGEGFNDFYFADDALQNVQAVKNMLDQFDVKSKVQQAKIKFSNSLDADFNKLLEEVTGIEAEKRFSATKARKRGESKGKFRLFIPPSHEDFAGLLYNFMGKGRQGDRHRQFLEDALIKPLNRGYREIDAAKQAIANDYKSLNKEFKNVKKRFAEKTPDGDYTVEDAIRVYLWDKHKHTIPGMSAKDQKALVDFVKQDSDLVNYAETLNIISKQEQYVPPTEGWDGGNIRIDLVDATGRTGRAEYFTEFQKNVDIIFSPENMNKIEAAYGVSVRSALEDMLHRISTGVNRPKGQSGRVNKFMNYLNGSVGSVMFFNTRSSLLQQMSIVNYINFADNNIFAAATAFANQKQYWADWAFIFNSDMLKQRRGGIQTDINGAELAQTVAKSTSPTQAVISKLLQLGFLPTQIGDNIAIATGGATFYRNRINKYIKDGLSKKEAEAKAFTDFQEITQKTQQSARPDMTSKQQASWIGKLILNFQNVTSQYNRLMKKAALDIKNRRITPPNTSQSQSDLSNASRILYYGAVQNIVFYSLQSALFALMFDDEEEENKQLLKKRERVINGTIDSILRGSGIYGAAVSTLKNMAIAFAEERGKTFNFDESSVVMEGLNFSPVVGIKARKFVNAEKTLNYNKKLMKEMETFDLDNPVWSAVTNLIEASTNAPTNRLYNKTINVRDGLDTQFSAFHRVLMFSGYSRWNLNVEKQEIKDLKEKIERQSKQKKKKNKYLIIPNL